MDKVILVFILIAIIFIFVKSFLNMKGWFNHQLPYQIVKIVQQAHKAESFSTEPYIYVSNEMRERLVYPLTIEQAEIIVSTQYPVTENNFEYKLTTQKYEKGVLCVTVIITIDYCDTVNGINLHFDNIPMCIKCKGSRNRGGLEIVSVEYNTFA